MNKHAMSQEYIKSRFGKMATAGDVLRGVDLKGKIAVLTGATEALERRQRRRWRGQGPRS